MSYYLHGQNIHPFSSHTKEHAWSDGTNASLLVSITNGHWIIIMHVGGKNDFIQNAINV